MSEASNRTFGLEQRHRERRMHYNLLNPGVGNWSDPSLDALYGSIVENGPINFSAAGTQGRAGVSLAAMRRPGDEDTARNWAINGALNDLNYEGQAQRQSLRDMTAGADIREAQARQAVAPMQDREAIDRAATPSGIESESLPGHLRPVSKPLTFGKPEKMLVAGKPQFVREGSDGQMYGLDRRAIDPATIAPPADPVGPLETVTGPDGKPIRVQAKDAIGKEPAAGTMKASTGQQKRVLNFFNRAEQADGELEKLEPEIQQMGIVSQGRMEYLPNFAQSQTGQSYLAAQRAFTEARLRKDSGAAIPEQEFVNDRRTYFAQPGDSAETLEQKRRARGAMLASLAFESGQALGEFVGDADEAKAITQRYKDRASGTVDMIAPDGGALRVPASDVDRLLKAGAKRK